MKIRESINYNHATGEYDFVFKPMSAKQFKERYGITFKEWKAELHKDDYRKKFKFNECYVDDDPYDQDVCGETNPLIEDSPERLSQSCIDAAYEI